MVTTAAPTFPEVLRYAAARFAAREALVDGDVRLTHAALLDAVRTTARGWLALGLERGDRVLLWAPDSWRWVVASLGVQHAGGAVVPVGAGRSALEAAQTARRTGARMVVLADSPAQQRYAELVIAAGRLGQAGSPVEGLPTTTDVLRVRGPGSADVFVGGVTDLDHLAVLAADVPDRDLDERIALLGPDDAVELRLTRDGGAGAYVRHRALVSAADLWAGLVEPSTADRMLLRGGLPQPMSSVALLAALTAGATVVVGAEAEAAEPPESADAVVRREQVTLAVAGCPAAPLPEGLRADLVRAYGSAVCSLVTTSRRHESAAGDEVCGRPVPGIELRVVRPGSAEDVPAGGSGELLVRGETVATTWLDDAGPRSPAPGWVPTGDIGHLDDGGNLVLER